MKTTLLLCIFSLWGTFAFSQLMNETQGSAAGTSITTGNFNVIYGDSAGYRVTTGNGHVIIGSGAGMNITTSGNSGLWHYNPTLIASFPFSSGNIFIGQGAGYSTSSGLDNVFVGSHAGWSNTFGANNTFIGSHSGWNNTTGQNNTFIGDAAGAHNTFGQNNTFLGGNAGLFSTTGSRNTFLGKDAGNRNTTGYQNTFVGKDAGFDNTTGRYNTAVGDSAGIDCGIGWGNTFIGHASGAATEYAENNTFVGHNAGWDNNRLNNTDDANFNTYVGSEAGYTNRIGEYNVMMGYRSDFQNSGSRSTGQVKTQNNYNVAVGAKGLLALSKNHTAQYGSNTYISANYATAIGDSARASGEYATTLGARTSASGMYSTAIGTGATVAQNNAMVLGGATTTDRVSVGIGTAAPNANASLDLADTDKGFLVNRLTTALRTTLGSGLTATEQGLIVYDTDDNAIYTWDGAAWQTSSGGTDSQDLSLSGNTLSLTNDATSVDLSGYLDNTDAQNLSLAGNTLNIDNGTGVDLSGYLDNTDTQLTEAQVDAYVANNGYLTSFTEVDGDVTNEIQDISLAGSNLSISSGSTIDLSVIDTDTHLSEAEVDAYVANNGYLTSFTEVDGDVTNEIQDISLAGSNLTISSGSTIDLSVIDTDTQIDSTGIAALGFVAGPHTVDTDTHLSEAEVDAYVANNGYLTTFTEVDGDVTNEIQDISLAGTNLTISSGSTIDLSVIDTDTQIDSTGIAALGFVAGPHTVDTDTHLSEAEVDAYVANNGYLTSFTEVDGDVTNEIQDLTGVLTEGNDGGAMQIKNIADPTDPQDAATKAYVDALETTVQNMQTQLNNMQLQLDDHEDRITFLEGCACDTTAGLWDNGTGLNETPILYQNIPNPFNGTSSIKYYVPSYAGSANIVISNTLGQIVYTFNLKEVGNYGEILFNSDGLAHGKYFYTMYVNHNKFETKSMLIE